MQVDLRILPTKIFFRTSTVFFLLSFKYHGVFWNQLEDYIGQDDIDMTEVILL